VGLHYKRILRAVLALSFRFSSSLSLLSLLSFSSEPLSFLSLVVLLLEELDFEVDVEVVFDAVFDAAFSAAFATFGSVVDREPGIECEEVVEFLVFSIRAVTLILGGLIDAAVAVIFPDDGSI
jgi:hypothetical protein